jgi:chaperone BCS1
MSPWLEGGLTLALLGGILAALRYGITRFVERLWTTTLHIRDPQMIEWLSEWLAGTEYAKRSRLLLGAIGSSDQDDFPRVLLEPGLGLHIFRYDGRWLFLQQTLEQAGPAGSMIRTSTLRIWGRDSRPLRRLAEQVRDVAFEHRRGKQVAYINDRYGNWITLRISRPRPLESVVLPKAMARDVLSDLKWFLGARQWHAERGLPYRRGYLLYGPPGNGKSSLLQALAGHFNLPLYVLSLANVEFTDMELALSVGRVPGRAVVALEDIEKIDFGTATAVTISGLLNAVDGPLASEGRLLVVTANDLEGIPEAFLRTGRVDRRWELVAPGRSEATRLFLRFFPGEEDAARRFAGIAANDGTPMSSLQQHLVRYSDPEEAVATSEDLDGIGWHVRRGERGPEADDCG